jgi:hypothetical protein
MAKSGSGEPEAQPRCRPDTVTGPRASLTRSQSAEESTSARRRGGGSVPRNPSSGRGYHAQGCLCEHPSRRRPRRRSCRSRLRAHERVPAEPEGRRTPLAENSQSAPLDLGAAHARTTPATSSGSQAGSAHQERRASSRTRPVPPAMRRTIPRCHRRSPPRRRQLGHCGRSGWPSRLPSSFRGAHRRARRLQAERRLNSTRPVEGVAQQHATLGVVTLFLLGHLLSQAVRDSIEVPRRRRARDAGWPARVLVRDGHAAWALELPGCVGGARVVLAAYCT